MDNNLEMYKHLKLKVRPEQFKYVLLDRASDINHLVSFFNKPAPFVVMGGADELSIVCDENVELEKTIKVEAGWRCIQIVGDMPFGSVPGMIATITSVLKEVGIGVCIISTYLKDLFFIYENNLDQDIKVLPEHGWDLCGDKW